MDAWQAADLINRTIFRPGWKIDARVLGDSAVDVEFRIETVDTSYPSPDGEYRMPKTLVHAVQLDVRDTDLLGVLRSLLREAHEIDEHEDREFLRVRAGSAWDAPFHPHKPMGEISWQVSDDGTREGARR